jgi:hypothetical protein
MDFNRQWTQFALDAEVDHYGTGRIAKAHNELLAEVLRLRNGCVACELEATKADAERWRYIRDNHAQGSSPTMDGNMSWRFTQLRWCVGRSPDEVVDKLIRKEYEA